MLEQQTVEDVLCPVVPEDTTPLPLEELFQKRTVGVAYGLGVDSTAMLVGMHARRMKPQFILWADVGSEKAATYAYLPVIQAWLKSVNWPAVTVVRNLAPKSPYKTIEGNMVMNATLPGAAFGMGSCTIKWKIAPQNKWANKDLICRAAWSRRQRVVKLIGFDATEGYRKDRAADKAHGAGADRKYEYRHPLIEWGWTREECKARIAEAGLPVPPKSACVFCPNQKPEEVYELTPLERGIIMRMECTAEPFNTMMHGLWRKPRKSDGRPGSITEFILNNKIPYEWPTDPMPLNPRCQKAANGYTFIPPHRDVSLAKLVETDRHTAIAEAL